MIRVLVADRIAQEGIDILKSAKDVEVVVRVGLKEEELSQQIGQFDGMIIRSDTKVTAKVLANCGRLKAIARAGVGVDNVDVKEATRKGVLVMNTPGGNTLSAAEHTMALILALCRNIVPACNSLKSGIWDRKKYTGNQLNNKSLGIIGLGRIGIAVARMAKSFNMRILGYDPLAVPTEATKLGVEICEDLERLLKESDIITVHVPKNEQTINMISANQIAMMKPTVRLINVARGGIINEDALYDALANRRIAGAALDVFTSEPPTNTRFTQFDNCLVTPHLGASTEEAQIEVAAEAARILLDALQGRGIRNAVNAPSIVGTMPAILNQYSELALRIGRLLSTITLGQIRQVDVQYRGTIADMDVTYVTLSFLVGLLQRHFDMPINIVNAPALAKERGIGIQQSKNPEPQDVSASLTARVTTDRITRTVTGSVFGNKLLRIIEIDGYKLEMTPQGTVVVIFNDDKPGVIGAVGTVCGRHNINIGTMGVAQKLEEQKAMLAVSLNQEPTVQIIEELSKLDFVNEIYVCRLD